MEIETSPLCECHVNTNEGTDTFVGIRFDGDLIKICFPIGYNLGKTVDEQKKDIKLLIRVLTNFSGIKERLLPKLFVENSEEVNFPIQAYMTVLNDYYNRGYYTENERFFTVNGKGPKNWTKTIKTQRAYPQDDCFVYLKTISQESKVDMANYITKINEFCVYEAYKKIGFLFSENIMRKPSIVFEKKVLWLHLRKNFV